MRPGQLSVVQGQIPEDFFHQGIEYADIIDQDYGTVARVFMSGDVGAYYQRGMITLLRNLPFFVGCFCDSIKVLREKYLDSGLNQTETELLRELNAKLHEITLNGGGIDISQATSIPEPVSKYDFDFETEAPPASAQAATMPATPAAP